MRTPIRPTPLRTPVPPRPLSVAPSPITLPSTPVNGFETDAAHGPRSQAPSGVFASSPPLSRDWYVYQPDGRHLGPVSTTFLARGWLTRQVPRDVYVGAAGEPHWRPLVQVQEIMEAARAMELGAAL
ncbi:MAG TPA: hypothetical protein VIY73_29390 [Polyangiaceae bacterium]